MYQKEMCLFLFLYIYLIDLLVRLVDFAIFSYISVHNRIKKVSFINFKFNLYRQAHMHECLQRGGEKSGERKANEKSRD